MDDAGGYSAFMNRSLLFTLVCMACSSCAPAQQKEAPEPEPDPRVVKALEAASILPDPVALAFRSALMADPERFFRLLDEAELESAAAGDLLQLVDKNHALPSSFKPLDLVSLNDYELARTKDTLSLRKAIIDGVMEMDAAARADGITLTFASTFRSYETQLGLFDYWVQSHGLKEAERFSARAGQSQHQLGTVIDFHPIEEEIASLPQGLWLEQNAWRYGFSMSYPPGHEHITGYMWEPWHFRYITKAGASIERDYFGGIQQYFLEFLREYRLGT